MKSWRGGVPQQVQDEMDAMLDHGIRLGISLLEEHGEFLPIMMAMGQDGQVAIKALQDEELAKNAVAYAARLAEVVANERDSLRATTSVTNGFSPERQMNLIKVDVEHRDGPCITVVAPYQLKKPLFSKTKKVALGELAAVAGERKIWA